MLEEVELPEAVALEIELPAKPPGLVQPAPRIRVVAQF